MCIKLIYKLFKLLLNLLLCIKLLIVKMLEQYKYLFVNEVDCEYSGLVIVSKIVDIVSEIVNELLL